MTQNKDESGTSSRALDGGVLVYVAYFFTAFILLYSGVIPWNSLTDRVLRWPVGSLVYGHVNPFHMNPEQSSRFFAAYVFFIFCKAVLASLPFVWLARKSFHRRWPDIAAWIACLCPFLIGANIGLGLRWRLATAVVLIGGVVSVYLLRIVTELPLSRAKRVLCSLPCWMFWFLWFAIVTGDSFMKLLPLLGMILYGLALRKTYRGSAICA